MRPMNFIAFDVHCAFCEGGWVTESGKEKQSWRVATSIPALGEVIGEVPRPRLLVIEEGPLAEWLVRELSDKVDQVVVADPYRNALIAKEGDKDDPIDWRKLAHLTRGGYVKAVHHNGTLERAAFKQHVQLYHQRVRLRQAEALRIVWRLRRLGLTSVKAKDLKVKDRGGDREALLKRLPDSALLRRDLRTMLQAYDLWTAQLQRLRREMIKASRPYEAIERLQALPGVKAVRAASLFAVIDTPFRFKSRQALWKYLGIGLERRRSGNGPLQLRVPRRCNRLLKNVILGAAKSAIASKDNPFADQYQRWLSMNASPRVARRNVARSMAAVMWERGSASSRHVEERQRVRPGAGRRAVGRGTVDRRRPRSLNRSRRGSPLKPRWMRWFAAKRAAAIPGRFEWTPRHFFGTGRHSMAPRHGGPPATLADLHGHAPGVVPNRCISDAPRPIRRDGRERSTRSRPATTSGQAIDRQAMFPGNDSRRRGSGNPRASKNNRPCESEPSPQRLGDSLLTFDFL